MSRIFGLGEKASKDQKDHDHAQLCALQETLAVERERLESLADAFDSFPGWDTFRENYLIKVRLPKLYEAAARTLKASDADRASLSGQIAEAEFLAQTRERVKTVLERLTLRQKGVQEKLMRADSQKREVE